MFLKRIDAQMKVNLEPRRYNVAPPYFVLVSNVAISFMIEIVYRGWRSFLPKAIRAKLIQMRLLYTELLRIGPIKDVYLEE